MSEEEKKAIQCFKLIKEGLENNGQEYWSFNTLNPKEIETILNLLDKQQKEIEENQVLIDDIKEHNIVYIDTPEFEEKFISKDKIREKIKELENKNEENKIELAKGIDTLNFDIIENAKNNIAINVNVRDILKELLGE